MIPNLGQSDGAQVLGQYNSSGWQLPTLGQLGGAINNLAMSPTPTLSGLSQTGSVPNFGFGNNPTNPFAQPPPDAMQRMLDAGRGQAGTDAGPSPYGGFRQFGASSGVANPNSGLGVGGGVGSPFQRTLGSSATNGNGYGGGSGSAVGGGVPKPQTQLDKYQAQLDQNFGQGWSANFTAQNGMDPISFYEREVPSSVTDPNERARIAVERAGNDAQWHPNEIQDWQQKHGNMPIPLEQWQKWSSINQGGGPDYGAGRGVDPYGVH